MLIEVLAGGLSPERDVSLRSGRRVVEALRDTGVAARQRDIDVTVLADWRNDPPTCVIPMIHGSAGEDGALREVLECVGLPFVGSSASACRLAFDKPIAKSLVRGAGVATPPAVAIPQTTFRELGARDVLDSVLRAMSLPVVVKPTKGGSALGVTRVDRADELPSAMVAAFSYGEVVLIEQWVEGVEIAVCIVENGSSPEVLPVIEIVPPGAIYDYDARYVAGSTEFHVPARLSETVVARAAESALTVHRTLGLRDLSRSDWIVDSAGVPWFLEVNVAPGMTETSLFPQALAHAGRDVGWVLAGMAERAVNARRTG